MEKLASVLIMIMSLVLINGLANANGGVIRESLTNGYPTNQTSKLQLDIEGETIPTDSSITFGASYILNYDRLDGVTVETSSSNITTYNITWKSINGNTITSNIYTIGTPVTTMKSNFFDATIEAPDAGYPAEVTMTFTLSDG